MKLSDIKIAVNPNTWMSHVAEEDSDKYNELYESHKHWLCKFATKLPSFSEGMWCLPITDEDQKKCTDDTSHGESVMAFCCNDSVGLPPMCAGVVIPLLTQGAERPILDRQKLFDTIVANGAEESVIPVIREMILGEEECKTTFH
ncbi:hypothetical protein VPHK479_0051 [Vibrio phage K479]